MHCTVSLGIVVECVCATMLPDLQASALTSSNSYHGNPMLRKGSIFIYLTYHNGW